MTVTSQIDHLVVVARTLDQGVQWCEATLGTTPGPGGEHPLMGTHNRLLRVATDVFPRAYLEIIAINPAARAPGRRRWFDMDDEVLMRAVSVQPRLVHFVASTLNAPAALESLRRQGIDRGPLVHAERPGAAGMLRWQISVREDGQRLYEGGLPTLIQWGDLHPADAMPESGLVLESVVVSHPRMADLRAAHQAIGLRDVMLEEGQPNLTATLVTPKGVVTLESAGT
jgi:hypothetical protein